MPNVTSSNAQHAAAKNGSRLSLPRLVILDLDGVVYRGDQPVPGAPAAIRQLLGAQVIIRYATNDSMATRAEYQKRLRAVGARVDASEIVTAVSAAGTYLRRHRPAVRRVLLIGESAAFRELREAGYEVVVADDVELPGYRGGPLPDRYDAVVVAASRSFNYGQLSVAASAIRGGAQFVATGNDGSYPTADGFLPAAGSIVAAVATASGKRPLLVGKPAPTMFETILEEAAVAPGEALVVGDNPDSDIVAARRAGIASALVCTGLVNDVQASALKGWRRPDLVSSDLATLVQELLSDGAIDPDRGRGAKRRPKAPRSAH